MKLKNQMKKKYDIVAKATSDMGLENGKIFGTKE
jgi:hypothetical protein